jgi:hypothetical protein
MPAKGWLMNPDILLTLGVLLLIPTIPMIFNGLKEGVAPRFAFVMILFSCGLIAGAFLNRPGGYTVNEVPEIMIATIKSVFR